MYLVEVAEGAFINLSQVSGVIFDGGDFRYWLVSMDVPLAVGDDYKQSFLKALDDYSSVYRGLHSRYGSENGNYR